MGHDPLFEQPSNISILSAVTDAAHLPVTSCFSSLVLGDKMKLMKILRPFSGLPLGHTVLAVLQVSFHFILSTILSR